jgi:hypothetical protein
VENLWENLFLVATVAVMASLVFAAYWLVTHTGAKHGVIAALVIALAIGFFSYSGHRMNAVRGDETQAHRSHIEDLYGIDLPEDFVVGSGDPQVVEFDDGDRLCVVTWNASISGTPPPRLKCSEGDVTEPDLAR